MNDGNTYDAKAHDQALLLELNELRGEDRALRSELANLDGYQARRDASLAQYLGVLASVQDRLALLVARMTIAEFASSRIEQTLLLLEAGRRDDRQLLETIEAQMQRVLQVTNS